MAAYLGQVGEFAEGTEDWTQHAECLGHFMAAKGIGGSEVEERRIAFRKWSERVPIAWKPN